MEIFLVKTDRNIDFELIKKFQKKEISDFQKCFEHCYSYYLTDKILKEFYRITDCQVELVSNKPYLKNREKYISLSHSGDYTALCFSDYDCGIDIEKIKPRHFQKIITRMSFPKAETLEEFYDIWTQYEASYKLNQIPLKTKTFRKDNYSVTACSINPNEIFEIYYQIGNTFSKAEN